MENYTYLVSALAILIVMFYMWTRKLVIKEGRKQLIGTQFNKLLDSIEDSEKENRNWILGILVVSEVAKFAIQYYS